MQTPSKFLRSLIRQKKENIEAAELKQAIISGYRDAISGYESIPVSSFNFILFVIITSFALV